jgi:hypothetical protein
MAHHVHALNAVTTGFMMAAGFLLERSSEQSDGETAALPKLDEE